MKQNTLVVAIVSGALCFAIGFAGGALLTRPSREKTEAAIAAAESKAEKAQTIAQKKIQAAKAETTRLQNELKRVANELKQAKDKLTAAENETQHAKAEERNQNIATKPLDEIKITSKPMFGIYLGEKLSEVQKRFVIAKRGLIWVVQDTSTVVEDCHINICKDRVWAITVWLKDNTKRNFDILKRKLQKEYWEYEIREVKGSRSKDINPNMPITYELQFKITIDSIPVLVSITFIDNATTLTDDWRAQYPDLAKNELSIQYIRLSLKEKTNSTHHGFVVRLGCGSVEKKAKIVRSS